MFLTELMQLLARNGSYPKYQHERRIDIFINFFLADILKRKFGAVINTVIPEFPLKKEDSHASTNLDYLAYSEVSRTAYLVELKTDSSSFNEEQCRRYEAALERPWTDLLEEIECIKAHTEKRHRDKYEALLVKLREMSPERKALVYIGPVAIQDELPKSAALISLEELQTMTDLPKHNDEWNIIRQYIVKSS